MRVMPFMHAFQFLSARRAPLPHHASTAASTMWRVLFRLTARSVHFLTACRRF